MQQKVALKVRSKTNLSFLNAIIEQSETKEKTVVSKLQRSIKTVHANDLEVELIR